MSGEQRHLGKYKGNFKTYTARLKEERHKRGYTLKDMAYKLNRTSPSTYKYIEDGVAEPKLSIMNGIAEILKKPAGYFFDIK